MKPPANPESEATVVVIRDARINQAFESRAIALSIAPVANFWFSWVDHRWQAWAKVAGTALCKSALFLWEAYAVN